MGTPFQSARWDVPQESLAEPRFPPIRMVTLAVGDDGLLSVHCSDQGSSGVGDSHIMERLIFATGKAPLRVKRGMVGC